MDLYAGRPSCSLSLLSFRRTRLLCFRSPGPSPFSPPALSAAVALLRRQTHAQAHTHKHTTHARSRRKGIASARNPARSGAQSPPLGPLPITSKYHPDYLPSSPSTPGHRPLLHKAHRYPTVARTGSPHCIRPSPAETANLSWLVPPAGDLQRKSRLNLHLRPNLSPTSHKRYHSYQRRTGQDGSSYSSFVGSLRQWTQ